MPKASTIKYAKETLTPQEFAAWETMAVKLSKSQLKAGERPPSGGEAPPKAEPAKTSEPAKVSCHDCDKKVVDLICSEDDDGTVRVCAECYTKGLPEALIVAAGEHADASDPEHEPGDLCMIIHAFWECMDEPSKLAATEHEGLQQFLANWASGEDEDEDEDEDE